MKISLPNVTLVGIDCVNIPRIQEAMDISQIGIEFGAVKLLTSLFTEDTRLVSIPPIKTIQEFSKFCISDLHKYVDTDFVLLVQYDGFVLNPQSWSNEFLQYDYTGASWLTADWSVRDYNFPESFLGTRVVGNGGFCLRSKKFLETSARLFEQGKIPNFHPEDVAMCVWYRKEFEAEGIRFAPPAIAQKFSLEGDDDVYENQFGFHGFSWTNIDNWINSHKEFSIVYQEYMNKKKI